MIVGTGTHGLTTQDLQHLEGSWINEATATRVGLFRVDSATGADIMGRKDSENYAGLVFPIYQPGEEKPREFILRRDHPPLTQRTDGTLKEERKYLLPPGRGNVLFFGPDEAPSALTDSDHSVLITEGIKKLCALWRLARHDVERPRFLPSAVGGAWSWRGTVGRTADANGQRVPIKGPIADLDRFAWRERQVIILFDSDAATNSDVARAREGLTDELRERGARVAVLYVPQLTQEGKTGLDDLLVAWGPERVLEWLTHAEEVSTKDPDPIRFDAPTVAALPDDLIDGWLGDAINAIAIATETPRELPALHGLGIVATCVQKTHEVEVEAGYREPLNLWTACALDSGNRKSAVHSCMVSPLLDWEAEREFEMKERIATAQSERQTLEERLKSLRSKAAKANGEDFVTLKSEITELEGALPDVPVAPRLWTQDCTPEKLGMLLAEHGERMAVLSDVDLSRWTGG